MKTVLLAKLSAATLLASSSFSIHAAEKYWMGSSCGWEWSSQCWSATVNGPADGIGQPQAGDNVYLFAAEDLYYFNNTDPAPELNSLNINDTTTYDYSSYRALQQSGKLASRNEIVGVAGHGQHNQYGNTKNVSDTLMLGQQVGSVGYYSLSGGALIAANQVIGEAGAGFFTQGSSSDLAPTSNTVSDTLTVAKQASSYGSYALASGTLSANNEVIGDEGGGNFYHDTGTNTVGTALIVGNQGSSYSAYNLYSGALTALQEIIGDAGNGTFIQGVGAFGYSASNSISGTLTVGKQAGSNGTYNLNAGTLNANQEVIGDAGYGTFNQSGGSNTVANTLTVAKQAGSQGYYYLVDGVVNDNNAVIGDAGYGGFTQGRGANAFYPGPNSNGGVHNVAETLTLGKQASGYGYYYLAEGKLNAKNIIVGDAGQGWFGQGDYYGYGPSNATNTVGETLTVGRQAGSAGEYHLFAGSLTAANEIIGDAGNGTFAQGEGNFGYSATNSVSNTLTVGKQAGSNGSYTLIAGTLNANHEVIGDAGTGTFIQVGGVNTIADSLTVGKQATGQGVYRLHRGTLSAVNEVIGDAGEGTFIQGISFGYGATNATNNVSGTLTLGQQAGGRGVYNLRSGRLNAANEIIGDAGNGTFIQGEGDFGYTATNSVGNTLTLGKQAGSSGTYNLLAGALNALHEVIGDAGTGTFNQSGGTNTINDTLTVGKQAGGKGFYNLFKGAIAAASEVIGDAGEGTFTQGSSDFGYSPTNSVSNTLTVGKQAGSHGTYNLISGALTALHEIVGDAGTGAFIQRGGTNAVGDTLTVGKQVGGDGAYSLFAGALTAANEVIGDAGDGKFFQGEGYLGYTATNSVSNTLTVGKQVGSNGYYLLAAGTLNAGHEVIGDAGAGAFNQVGGINTIASSLVLGKEATGQGAYSLFNGALSAVNQVIGAAGEGIFTQGINFGDGATQPTNNISGTLTLGQQAGANGIYNLRSGALIAANEIIGDAGNGTFTHGEGNFGYSATNNVSDTLTIGKQAGSQGVYNLIAGTLTALQQIVGDAGTGVFNQSGGTNTVNATLTMGKQNGGQGSYNLASGALTATDEIVGDAGTGIFTQGEGNFGYSATNNVSGTLAIGKQSGTQGTYYLLAGALNTANTIVGDAGNGIFRQTGGTHTVGDTLTLGKQVNAYGNYNLYGAKLTAANEVIGDAGGGQFFHSSSGINNVSGTLTLGKQSSGSGTYQLVTGQLNTLNTVIGDAGTGVFTQYLGKHTVAGTLTLGKQVGGIGTYNLLFGGALSAASEVVGDAGTGVVNQNGGTNVVEQLTFGKQSSGVGTYNLTGGSLTVGNIVNGAGTGALLISGGALNFGTGTHVVGVDTLAVSGQGVINLADSAITTFQNDVTHNGQAINLGTGSNAIFNAAFNGAGPFTGTGTATFNGVFNPGNSPALFSVAGDMVLGESSKSVMEVAGSTRGSQYDAVNVGGQLTLDGELKIQFLNGFAPQLGSSFDLFDAETLSGQFDLITLSGLDQGLSWKLDYLTDAVGTLDIVRLSVISSVPLPGSIWLMQFALFSLAAVQRARKRRV